MVHPAVHTRHQTVRAPRPSKHLDTVGTTMRGASGDRLEAPSPSDQRHRDRRPTVSWPSGRQPLPTVRRPSADDAAKRLLTITWTVIATVIPCSPTTVFDRMMSPSVWRSNKNGHQRNQLPNRPDGPAHVPTPRHRSPRCRAEPLDGPTRRCAERLVTKKKRAQRWARFRVWRRKPLWPALISADSQIISAAGKQN